MLKKQDQQTIHQFNMANYIVLYSLELNGIHISKSHSDINALLLFIRIDSIWQLTTAH